MSQENVEVVRSAYEAFARGDFETALELFHPDIEWHDPDRPGGGTYHGHEGLIRNLEEWLEGWEEFRLVPWPPRRSANTRERSGSSDPGPPRA
jgi:hypothetical protein